MPCHRERALSGVSYRLSAQSEKRTTVAPFSNDRRPAPVTMKFHRPSDAPSSEPRQFLAFRPAIFACTETTRNRATFPLRAGAVQGYYPPRRRRRGNVEADAQSQPALAGLPDPPGGVATPRPLKSQTPAPASSTASARSRYALARASASTASSKYPLARPLSHGGLAPRVSIGVIRPGGRLAGVTHGRPRSLYPGGRSAPRLFAWGRGAPRQRIPTSPRRRTAAGVNPRIRRQFPGQAAGTAAPSLPGSAALPRSNLAHPWPPRRQPPPRARSLSN